MTPRVVVLEKVGDRIAPWCGGDADAAYVYDKDVLPEGKSYPFFDDTEQARQYLEQERGPIQVEVNAAVPLILSSTL